VSFFYVFFMYSISIPKVFNKYLISIQFDCNIYIYIQKEFNKYSICRLFKMYFMRIQ